MGDYDEMEEERRLSTPLRADVPEPPVARDTPRDGWDDDEGLGSTEEGVEETKEEVLAETGIAEDPGVGSQTDVGAAGATPPHRLVMTIKMCAVYTENQEYVKFVNGIEQGSIGWDRSAETYGKLIIDEAYKKVLCEQVLCIGEYPHITGGMHKFVEVLMNNRDLTLADITTYTVEEWVQYYGYGMSPPIYHKIWALRVYDIRVL